MSLQIEQSAIAGSSARDSTEAVSLVSALGRAYREITLGHHWLRAHFWCKRSRGPAPNPKAGTSLAGIGRNPDCCISRTRTDLRIMTLLHEERARSHEHIVGQPERRPSADAAL